jgi:hypothetical protein
MELKDFIKTSLASICEAVRELQEEERGEYYNPVFRFDMDHKKDVKGIIQHGSRNYSLVEFDVAVTTEKTGDMKGRAGIAVIGADVSGKLSQANASRIKFTVPVLLPNRKITTP